MRVDTRTNSRGCVEGPRENALNVQGPDFCATPLLLSFTGNPYTLLCMFINLKLNKQRKSLLTFLF